MNYFKFLLKLKSINWSLVLIILTIFFSEPSVSLLSEKQVDFFTNPQNRLENFVVFFGTFTLPGNFNPISGLNPPFGAKPPFDVSKQISQPKELPGFFITPGGGPDLRLTNKVLSSVGVENKFGRNQIKQNLQENKPQNGFCKKEIKLKQRSIPIELYGERYSTRQELIAIPTCKGQISRDFYPSGSVYAERTNSLFVDNFTGFFQSDTDREIFRLFNLDRLRDWQQEVHTVDSFGVYIWYFLSLYRDAGGLTKSASYVDESATVIDRIIRQEYSLLLRDRYCTNPLFQAAFKRALDQGSGILAYVIEDETELFSKEQTKDKELAYLNELNTLLLDRSPNLEAIVTNLKNNFNLGAPPTIAELYPNPTYWDNYFSYCYRTKYLSDCRRKGKTPVPLEVWRDKEETLIYRAGVTGFSTSPRKSFTREKYQEKYGPTP